MPRRSQRIAGVPVHTPSALEITKADWTRAQDAYGRFLNDAVRGDIIRATTRFVEVATCERAAEPVKQTKRNIADCKEAARNLQEALTAIRSSLARIHVEKNFTYQGLSDKWAGLFVGRIFTLSHALGSLEAACDATQKELGPRPAGGILGGLDPTPYVDEGHAWSDWICHLTNILRASSLPTGARKDKYGESPFVALVRQLETVLPAELLRPTHSMSSLAKRISEARRNRDAIAERKRSNKSRSK
jgi:hypothetical protein